ncbi:MAG TPA: ParB/Srx family N-terminal domain-containing protein [Sphingomonadaceae bacterium]|nr:ParB/Srx family N-terminal domain-containing protein [Sphingomonadaceae bacterium]
MPQAEKTAASWPVYSVQPRAIGDLIPYARNARTHSDEQVAQLATLIQEYGWTMPILVDDAGEIIAGHGRVLAAHRLGLTEVPVAVATGWSEEQKRSYRIADNRLAELSTWDDDLLKIEIGELQELGADLTVTGFDEAAIAKLLEAGASISTGGGGNAKLAERFGIPPFSILNAREGWWQDRKRAWLALGIQSELGRGAPIGGSPMPMDRKANAVPGGSPLPSADYSKTKARGDGRGRAVA